MFSSMQEGAGMTDVLAGLCALFWNGRETATSVNSNNEDFFLEYNRSTPHFKKELPLERASLAPDTRTKRVA